MTPPSTRSAAPVGDIAQCRDAVGDEVGAIPGIVCNPVEELMKGDEVGPLDVPMGLLGLGAQSG